MKSRNKPEITVVMSTYNCAEGNQLITAIGSIREQSFSNWELIICDDGSTDGTQERLKQICGKDERIRLLFNKSNRKSAYARNQCIKKARGRYIAIMDADDVSAKDRLRRQYCFLEMHAEYDFVGSRGEYFVREVGDDRDRALYFRKPKKEDFLFTIPFVHASCMFRTVILKEAGGYDERKSVVRCEDYDLLLRLYAAGKRGYNLPDVLYYIRRDDGQYKRRKYRYRFNEAGMRYRRFRELGLMPKALPFVVKPLIVGIIPPKVITVLQRRRHSQRKECTRGILKGKSAAGK